MKNLLLLLAFVASIQNSFAQTPGSTLETSDFAFANLDKTNVHSQILYDRVFHTANLQFFDTSTDTSSSQHYLQANYELYLANYNNSQLLSPQDIDDLIWTTQQYPAVQIGVLLAQFQRINYDFIESDGNGQYNLKSGSTYDDLYTTQDVNVVSQLQTTIKKGATYFQLADWGIFSNRNVYVSSIVIDFGNGSPLSTIVPNGSNVAVNYTTEGEKVINYTVNLTDGSQFTAKSKVYVIEEVIRVITSPEIGKIDKPNQVQATPPYPYNDGISLVEKIRVQASIPFQGYDEGGPSKGVGDVVTYYAEGRTSLQKPLVILDGFDPNDKHDAIYLYDNRLSYSKNGVPTLLGDELRANNVNNGYDVVIVNFPKYAFQVQSRGYCNLFDPVTGACLQTRNTVFSRPRDGGADYIERNARVVVKVLDSLNAKLQANGSTEKLMLIGPSMGGLISRLALRYMEQNNMNHNTKLWVSFDSPHWGANIPIGFQYMIKYFAEKLNNKDAIDGLASLNTPAAKQILLDHPLKSTSFDSEIPAGADGFRNVFAQTLADAGFPQAECIRKVALNNGSKNGYMSFPTCTEGVHIRARFTNTTLIVCKAVGIGLCSFGPIGCIVSGFLSAGCIAGRSRILDSKVFTAPSNNDRCKVLETEIFGFGSAKATFYAKGQGSNQTGLDVVPAGTYDVFEEITSSIPLKLTKKMIKEDPLNLFVKILAKQDFDSTSFIPSVSSYALLNKNRNWGSSLENIDVATETPFNAIYAPTNENQEHVTVTQLGVNFLYAQILASNNCSGGNNCPPQLTISNTLSSQSATYQASVSITATNQIINSNVVYRAGQNINLNAGFIANSQTGTVFTAIIEGCQNQNARKK